MKKGFTLIELLVVIAIIGLLASVVLASLKDARARAADASVKQNLGTIRSQSAVYFSEHQNYNNFLSFEFPTDPVEVAAFKAAVAAGGNSGGYYAVADQAYAGANWWIAFVHLKTSSFAWCVDYTGEARKVDLEDFDWQMPDDNYLENYWPHECSTISPYPIP